MKRTKENQTPNGVKSLKAKLLDIMSSLGVVEKQGHNKHFNYDFVKESQISALFAPKLAEAGILFTTSITSMDVHHGGEGLGITVAVTTEHTFHDTESGEMLVGKGAGVGWDSGDKGVYKAITGATKFFLMKNFLVSDGQDPEAGNQAPEAPTETRHRPTREYDQEPPTNKAAANADLINLKAWLNEAAIPEGFLLAMLKEKKLVAPNLQNLANAPAGVIRRCLSAASQRNLIAAYKASLPNEPKKGKAPPPVKKGARKTAEPEFDQTGSTETRKPIVPDINAEDYLLQEGYNNWRPVRIHFGKQRGTTLGELTPDSLSWWIHNWVPQPHPKTKRFSEADVLLDCGLISAQIELGEAEVGGGEEGGGYDG